MNITEKNLLKLAAYRRELYTHQRLKFLFFELTDKCNLNCLHCGSNCDPSKCNNLDLDIIKQTLDEVAKKYDSKNIMICLTGGEPMLYDGIYDVISYSKKLGFAVGITSNATCIDEKATKCLAKAGLDTISISIDGLKDTHDSFRRSVGSFDKAINGIKSLQNIDIEPQVTTVVNKTNIKELDDMFKLMQELDICSWRITNIDPIGRAKVNKELLLDKNELLKVFNFIKEKRFDNTNEMEVTYGCAHFVSYDFENFIRDFYFQCGAGTMVASVAANGDILACLDIERRLDLVQGNIYKDNFIDVWENKYKIFRQDWSNKSKSCKDCAYKNVCMGDSAHTWDYDKNEPTYCMKCLEA